MHWNANKRKVSLFISRFRFQLSSSNMLWWKLYYHWRCKWCDLTHTKQSDTDTAYDCVIWTKMRHKCRWVCRLDIDISYYYLWTIFYIIGIKQTQERERGGEGWKRPRESGDCSIWPEINWNWAMIIVWNGRRASRLVIPGFYSIYIHIIGHSHFRFNFCLLFAPNTWSFIVLFAFNVICCCFFSSIRLFRRIAYYILVPRFPSGVPGDERKRHIDTNCAYLYYY